MRLNRRIHVRATGREVMALAGLAQRRGLTRSEVLRQMIRREAVAEMGAVWPGDTQSRGDRDERPGDRG